MARPAGRPILRRVGIALAGMLAAVLLLEVAARVFLPDVPGRFTRLDEVTGWSHVPGSQGWWTGEYGEFRAWVRINADGLRDREIPRRKPAGTARVLTLGDSITAAFQVPLEETFQKVLEQRLNARATSPRYEVLNAGVNGYGTDQALLYYRHRGADYRPDVVLLMFYLGNDIKDNDPRFRAPFSNYAKPHFVLAQGGLRLVEFPYRPPLTRRVSEAAKDWLAPLRIYRLAYVAAVHAGANPRRLVPGGEAEPAPATTDPAETWNGGWALTRALLGELRREVEARGSRLIIALVPPPDAVDPEYWTKVKRPVRPPVGLDDPDEQEAVVAAFLRGAGFHFVSLVPPLRRAFATDGQPLYFYFDRHLNAAGHRVVADTLHGYLARVIAPRGD